MRIAICGSLSFAREMLEIKNKLEAQKHKVVIPKNTEKYAKDIKQVEDKWSKIESDVIRAYFEEIKKVDAILVVNKDKNGVKYYVGGNGLIEMAFAHVLKKKVFLLNGLPKMNYSDEIEAMKPVILNGDVTKIK